MSATNAANRPTTLSLAKIKMQDLNSDSQIEAAATFSIQGILRRSEPSSRTPTRIA